MRNNDEKLVAPPINRRSLSGRALS